MNRSTTIKPPALVSDVYRDLRDRRLLPLVAAVLVAIPAVPILLGSNSENPAPLASDATAALAEEIPTMPAVLTSEPGLRDYRKRLDAMKSKDPFAQRFSGPSAEAAAAGSVTDVTATDTGPGAPADAASPAVSGSGASIAGSGTATELDPASTSTSTPSSTTSSDGSASSSGGTASDEPAGGSGAGGEGSSDSPDVRWFSYRLDVLTGPAGDAESRKDVKRLTVLPSQSNPVAMFMSVDERGKRAAFLVSDDVVRTHGDGRCLPSPADCQILTLRRGDRRTFEYAPRGDADRFVIEVQDIRAVRVGDPGGSGGDRAARSGLENFLGL